MRSAYRRAPVPPCWDKTRRALGAPRPSRILTRLPGVRDVYIVPVPPRPTAKKIGKKVDTGSPAYSRRALDRLGRSLHCVQRRMQPVAIRIDHGAPTAGDRGINPRIAEDAWRGSTLATIRRRRKSAWRVGRSKRAGRQRLNEFGEPGHPIRNLLTRFRP